MQGTQSNIVFFFFFLQTQCQDTEDDDESNSDDPEAEQDEMLVEYAGEIVPNLGKAMTPDDFTQYFSLLLPLFLTRMVRLYFICCRNYSYLLIYLLYLPTYFTYLLYLLTYLLTHSLTHLLTHSLTHSMVQSPSWVANQFSASQEIPHIV